jgi:hypothetical protein
VIGPRRAHVAALALIGGCSGRLASESARPAGSSSSSSATVQITSSASSADAVDAATEVGIYGESFQGDAGQCALVVCNGGQVCCVISLGADGPTAYPNNRCDYDCVALCMDSCPVAANQGPQGTPVVPDAAGSCGGPLGCGPVNEAGAD